MVVHKNMLLIQNNFQANQTQVFLDITLIHQYCFIRNARKKKVVP